MTVRRRIYYYGGVRYEKIYNNPLSIFVSIVFGFVCVLLVNA